MTAADALPAAFLVFAAAVAAGVAGLLLRAFRGRAGIVALLGLAAWLGFAGAMNGFGLLRDPALRPPGVVLLVVPVFMMLFLVVGLLPTGKRLAASLPIGLLVGFQVFRVGVEWTLAELHGRGLVPRLMTLAGGNVEIVIALSAPLVAWIATRSAAGRRVAFAWNLAGVASLVNVAARAVLSSPGPLNLLHTEVPNVAFGIFPFGLIPGFMAPLAFAVHMLTFRALRMARVDDGKERRTVVASPREA